jgi:hypothetical protein
MSALALIEKLVTGQVAANTCPDSRLHVQVDWICKHGRLMITDRKRPDCKANLRFGPSVECSIYGVQF